MADKNAKMEILFKLTAAGCHCNNKNYITVASEDNKILNRHTDQLGKYFFEGKMYSERPVYVNKGTIPTYSIYWNEKNKAWEVGKTVGRQFQEPTLRTKIDKKCPADPVASNGLPPSKEWTWERKNKMRLWREAKLTVEC